MSGEADHRNVIPIERGRRGHPPRPPLSLREAILAGIRSFSSGADFTCEFTQGAISALVGALLDAGLPYEAWKHELGAEVIAVLETIPDLWVDHDDDPLVKVETLLIGNLEIGAVYKFYHGSHKAFRVTPAGPVELGTFPTFDLAKEAVCDAYVAEPLSLPDPPPPA